MVAARGKDRLSGRQMGPPAEPENGWFVLRSQPKHERIATQRLRQMAEVEVFCPHLRFQRPTVRGPKWFVEAMFPGYLFARFDYARQHREVRYAAGVSGLLEFGGRIPQVSDDVIQALREETVGQEMIEIQPELEAGTTVKVVHGALRGFEAVITRVMPGRERVRILLNFLGREIEAEVANPAVLPPRRHPLARGNF